MLREIALRPRMWVRSLSELEALLWGYGTALQVHGIAEPYPFNSSRAFSDWLRARFGWGMAPGWARAIEEHAGDEEPFEVFFRLVEEYRLDQLPDARA
ncbi:hypothetical protein LV78_002537 [Actinosynnema pretiosum]|nr:hypothetical protein [Actinosynnema pretiosum]